MIISPGLGKKADTGIAGSALQNGTPTFLTWTAPADGQMHPVMLLSLLGVTSNETGGQVNVQYTDMAGSAQNYVLYASGLTTGSQTANNAEVRERILLPSGGTVSIVQVAALTGGAATFWAQIWAA